jgi:hypothetical protein
MDIDIAGLLQIAITTIIVPFVAWGVTEFTRWIKEKRENEVLDKYLKLASDSIVTAVADTMQVFVGALKTAGEWNEETQKEAFERARLMAIELMGATVWQALDMIVKDSEAWLSAKIEQAVRDEKLKEKAAENCIVTIHE